MVLGNNIKHLKSQNKTNSKYKPALNENFGYLILDLLNINWKTGEAI